MPIYEYECASCGHLLEVLQKVADAPLTQCPQCHKVSLSKLVSASSFQLKGTGWYVTDFRDKGKQKPANSSKEEGSSTNNSDAAGETKTDSGSTDTTNNETKSNGGTAASS